MLHMVAFSASTATSTALTNVAGVSDPVLRVSGNFIYLPALSSIAGAYALGTAVSGAQLQAPSLRRFVNMDVSPIDSGSTPTNPVPFTPRFTSPIKLDPDEAIQALVKSTATAQANVLVHLSDGPITPVTGEVVTLQFTFTAPSGNYTWNNASITLGQTLPVGSYDVVGARVEGSGCIAARFVPVGGIYRPGIICVPTAVSVDPRDQRYGAMGTLFNFNQLTPPSIDLFHVGASGTITGYLDLIKKS